MLPFLEKDGTNAETARRLCLYADYDPETRTWSSPLQIPAVVVETRSTTTAAMLNRVGQLRQWGMYRAEVLEIEHEIYAPVTQGFTETELNGRDLEHLLQNGVSLLKVFYRRLVETGLLKVDVDMTVLGVPLLEFIAES